MIAAVVVAFVVLIVAALVVATKRNIDAAAADQAEAIRLYNEATANYIRAALYARERATIARMSAAKYGE